jgi:hypothetical protein
MVSPLLRKESHGLQKEESKVILEIKWYKCQVVRFIHHYDVFGIPTSA